MLSSLHSHSSLSVLLLSDFCIAVAALLNRSFVHISSVAVLACDKNLSVLQSKVPRVARPLVLPQVAMVPHLHMGAHHSTHKHSQHTAATQATHLLQQPPRIQAMVAATLKLVLMVATHRRQQLHTAVRHPTVGPELVGMTPMVPKDSRHMEVQEDMGARVHSPALSLQLVVVVSGRSSQITKADHTTTTKSQGSASGTAQLTCEATQTQLQAQSLLQQDCSSGQHRSGNADYSCAWHPQSVS